MRFAEKFTKDEVANAVSKFWLLAGDRKKALPKREPKPKPALGGSRLGETRRAHW